MHAWFLWVKYKLCLVDLIILSILLILIHLLLLLRNSQWESYKYFDTKEFFCALAYKRWFGYRPAQVPISFSLFLIWGLDKYMTQFIKSVWPHQLHTAWKWDRNRSLPRISARYECSFIAIFEPQSQEKASRQIRNNFHCSFEFIFLFCGKLLSLQ